MPQPQKPLKPKDQKEKMLLQRLVEKMAADPNALLAFGVAVISIIMFW